MSEQVITEKKTLDIKDILKNKKIKVVPIRRDTGYLSAGHDGDFLFTGTFWSTDLRRDPITNRLMTILTREEQEVFEKELNYKPGHLSFYNKDSEFWTKTLRVKLDKEGAILNLADPIDFLKYKVLQVSKFIAPSWDAKYQSGEYKFALVDEDDEIKETVSKGSLIAKAYKHFGKVEDNVEEMQNILRVYGKKSNSVKKDFLQAEINKLIESDIKQFLAIVEDKSFKTKVFIDKALQIKALDRTANSGYALVGGDEIGRNLQEAVEFLESPRYQDIYLKIKAQIENSRK
jgi:hypothetical protein